MVDIFISTIYIFQKLFKKENNMLTPIVNLKCINDPTYNKLITIDILNMKLVIINNDDNIDTGDTIL